MEIGNPGTTMPFYRFKKKKKKNKKKQENLSPHSRSYTIRNVGLKILDSKPKLSYYLGLTIIYLHVIDNSQYFFSSYHGPGPKYRHIFHI